jgi:hypothetical protein
MHGHRQVRQHLPERAQCHPHGVDLADECDAEATHERDSLRASMRGYGA